MPESAKNHNCEIGEILERLGEMKGQIDTAKWVIPLLLGIVLLQVNAEVMSSLPLSCPVQGYSSPMLSGSNVSTSQSGPTNRQDFGHADQAHHNRRVGLQHGRQ